MRFKTSRETTINDLSAARFWSLIMVTTRLFDTLKTSFEFTMQLKFFIGTTEMERQQTISDLSFFSSSNSENTHLVNSFLSKINHLISGRRSKHEYS